MFLKRIVYSAMANYHHTSTQMNMTITNEIICTHTHAHMYTYIHTHIPKPSNTLKHENFTTNGLHQQSKSEICSVHLLSSDYLKARITAGPQHKYPFQYIQLCNLMRFTTCTIDNVKSQQVLHHRLLIVC